MIRLGLPPVGDLAVRVGGEPVLPADVREFADPGGEGLRAPVPVLGREPGLEEVRGFDHVIVHADDLRQVLRAALGVGHAYLLAAAPPAAGAASFLTDRQIQGSG